MSTTYDHMQHARPSATCQAHSHEHDWVSGARAKGTGKPSLAFRRVAARQDERFANETHQQLHESISVTGYVLVD